MVPTKALEIMLKTYDISLGFYPLPKQVQGHIDTSGGSRDILINDSIKENEPLYRCVLAEEIGHKLHTVGDNTPKKNVKKRKA